MTKKPKDCPAFDELVEILKAASDEFVGQPMPKESDEVFWPDEWRAYRIWERLGKPGMLVRVD